MKYEITVALVKNLLETYEAIGYTPTRQIELLKATLERVENIEVKDVSTERKKICHVQERQMMLPYPVCRDD